MLNSHFCAAVTFPVGSWPRGHKGEYSTGFSHERQTRMDLAPHSIVSLGHSLSCLSLPATSRLGPHGGWFSSWSRNHGASVLPHSWPVGGKDRRDTETEKERNLSCHSTGKALVFRRLDQTELMPAPDPATVSMAMPCADWLSPGVWTITAEEDVVTSIAWTTTSPSSALDPFLNFRSALQWGHGVGKHWAAGAHCTGSLSSELTA